MEPGCPPAGGWEAPGWMVLLAYGPEWRWALAIGPVGCGVGPGCKSHALRDGTVPVGGAEWCVVSFGGNKSVLKMTGVKFVQL